MNFICSLLFSIIWLFCSAPAQAETLAERVAAFPDWQSKPTVQTAEGDLAYPAWLAGTWRVKSTLVDLVAPLPGLTTPGFESNRDYLNQPIEFDVRFVRQKSVKTAIASILKSLQSKSGETEVVADRAFNGLNLAKAYLGDRAVLAVKVDPSSPNRQITLLRGDRQLVSIVNARAVETPAADQFITTEIFQQVFRGASQPYLNQVETTTAYKRGSAIEANQITAVYLSPQDPDYFKAGETPVALYRYRLEFLPADDPNSLSDSRQ
ncbi:hypothetical protein C7B65_01605 [Phormidesmis priestleyi ULC007]|uniref:DUF6816 domain-containing protein n=1 Tax=Phormidesmis priestleyi ULC007 TaxID=1920490 RepID=A0A2T1DNQ9_9CYAN|nr:hypothetical protein [Phormidesmis priestleyi]PSB22126.1 hypothetical protein C7B65_01605 [Phormidesmis priestleyi ULC007]PZO52613.1 MAG: hypothetical protein DCF14_06595 [Phormidesmis priestleyi]